MEVRPFTIHVPDDVLEDLRQRLGQTRFPDEIPGSGWDYGSNLDYLKALVHYWRTDFDWRAQEEQLNRLHHYKTPVDGLNIHFIHERGSGPRPMPLVMTHGWPSCFFEMTKILPLLTDPGHHGGDPADAFDLVVPSLPGFGFSDHATEHGMDVQRVAGLWNTLMTDNLGYPRFAAQGGDIGAGVTAWLGYAHADNLYGIHLTSITRPTPYLGHRMPSPSPRPSRRSSTNGRGGSRKRAATPIFRVPSPRPLPTVSTTPRPAWPPGLWRNTAPGATATATWKPDIPRTNC
jgi:pimeloyl-ACP methyl ester carboxylesterase